MTITDGGVTAARVGENSKKGKSGEEVRVQGIKNIRVKQDLGRWLLCELRRIGVDFADREESIFLLEPFTRTPRRQNWKNWRPRGTVRGLLSRMSAFRWK